MRNMTIAGCRHITCRCRNQFCYEYVCPSIACTSTQYRILGAGNLGVTLQAAVKEPSVLVGTAIDGIPKHRYKFGLIGGYPGDG